MCVPAVTVVALRAHTASADEVRRVVVFSAGFLLFMGVAAVYDLAEAFAPGDWVSNYRWSPTILLMELLRFPGLILLWYAVLAARIPHLREAVRAFYRRLLMRPGLLGAADAVPAGVLVWLIGRSPEREVGAVLADPLAQSLVAAVGILLLLIAARERILIRLDSWILPEAADQRLALADAAGVLAQGRADHDPRRDPHPDGAARLRLTRYPAGCGRYRDPSGRFQRPAGPVRAPAAPDGHRPPAGDRRAGP